MAEYASGRDKIGSAVGKGEQLACMHAADTGSEASQLLRARIQDVSAGS